MHIVQQKGIKLYSSLLSALTSSLLNEKITLQVRTSSLYLDVHYNDPITKNSDVQIEFFSI